METTEALKLIILTGIFFTLYNIAMIRAKAYMIKGIAEDNKKDRNEATFLAILASITGICSMIGAIYIAIEFLVP